MSVRGDDPPGRPDAAATGQPFTIGAWTVDPALDEISRAGQTIKLEPRKMLLLVTLARRPGEVVTIEQLLDAVWSGLVVTQSSIYQSVAQLRKTLGDNPTTPEYIATIPRKGYRLIAPVGRPPSAIVVAAKPTAYPSPTVPDGPPIETAVVVPAALPRATRASTPGVGRRGWLLGAAGGAAVVAIGAGGWWWWQGRIAPDGIVRIAVLPFADRSDGAIEQASADGLANDVIHRFERSENLLVLARNSTFTFRRMGEDPAALRALKQQLNADYALLGELFRTRDRIRVAVRLLAVASGQAIWNSVFTKADDRLAEMPGLIANGVLQSLGLKAGPATEMNPLEAYELYLLGLNAYQTQRSIEGIRKARDYFQHAIDTDPSYARAYAGLANTWLSQATYGFGIEWRDAAARAQPLIDKALTLDPNLLEGLVAQGRLHMFAHWTEGDRARAVMQKAVDLYPGNAEAQFGLGNSYAYDEQPREAVKRYAIALELDPLSFVIHSRWGQDATFLGDFEAARVHFARAGALMPKSPWRFIGPGLADYARGHLDDAVANYRLQFELDPRRPDAWSELAWYLLDLGLPAQARQAFDRKAELSGRTPDHGIDEAWVALADGKASSVPAVLTERGLDRPVEGQWEVDRLVMQAIAGKTPTVPELDRLVENMRSDTVPWVGSYWIFHGTFAWIDLAMLYAASGSPERGQPLLDQAQAMLTRLSGRGNAFHAIPFLEARIAALHGRHDVAVARIAAAIDAGWRRAWILAFDPAFRRLRGDPRLAPLVARVADDMARQRTHVG